MSDAIRKLRDYLAKSPSVIYPEDVLEYLPAIEAENAKLREALAISVPLPLDDNCCAVHPDDVIGYNVGGEDFFWKVKEMRLTRYPKKGQPVLWVVRTANEEGSESPYVCWGGRCRAVHKVSAQTYSPEYLEVYDENKRLQAENAKLRELAALMYRDMQGVLDMSTDTVWVDDTGTLRDEMDCHMQTMAELGMPPADYERRIRDLGVEVDW